MLPRSLFLIIVASCWLQINAVPFHSRNDYQDYGDDEDVMDYAFADNTGKKNIKSSLVETVKNTIASMEKLGVLKDKNNINLNANAPRNKKVDKKPKSTNHKRKVHLNKKNHHQNKKKHDKKPKHSRTSGNKDEKSTTKYTGDITRRSTQQLFKEIPTHTNVINQPKRTVNEIKSENNHCAFSRRSNDETLIQTINLNSSYPDLDEDLILNSHAKMKKIQTIFTNAHMTLCWTEITTIKEDKSVNPPKRLILREASISFENSAAIPDEYLTCPIVDGDITMEPNEMICKTSFAEGIEDETRLSRTVNLTKVTREDNIDVTVNKIIKCTMGPVITKDVYQWINETDSTRQRVEIKVSPLTYNTEDICNSYNELNNLLTNESAECSDESNEQDTPTQEKVLKKNTTNCIGDNCDERVINQDTTIAPLNMEIDNLLIKTTMSELFTTNFNESFSTIKPSGASEINDVLSTGFTHTTTTTEPPQILSSTDHNITLFAGNSCTGPNCSEIFNDKISILKNNTTDVNDVSQENITSLSLEDSCEGSCDNSLSVSDFNNENSTDDNDQISNISSASGMSTELAAKEKDKLYIPKPFVCPVADEKICAHLKQVSELQSMEHSSEENSETFDENLTSIRDSESSEEKSQKSIISNEQNSMSDVSLSDSTILPDEHVNNEEIALPITSGSQILKSVKTTTSKYTSEINNESSLQQSAETLSSENISDDANSMINLDNNSETFLTDSTELLMNQSHNIEGISDSKFSGFISSSSEEQDISYLNVSQSNDPCDEFGGKCKKINGTNVLRSTSPSVSPSVQTATTKENESDDSGSCDCDEDSNESKKCNPATGLCSSDINYSKDKANLTQLTSMHSTSDELKNSVESINKEKGILPNHKLSLKIFVALEHIDENKENLRLAQVEKNVLLTELPDEHGNHSLYWQIKALNKSISHVDSLKDILNCTMLEKLTEDAIIEKLNDTNLNNKKYIGNNIKSYHKRYRRNIDNITLSNHNSTNNNLSSNGDSVLRDCILPNIREDIRKGLHDMLTELSDVLNNSRNNSSDLFRIDSATATMTTITTPTTTTAAAAAAAASTIIPTVTTTVAAVKNEIVPTTESSLVKNTTVTSRNKRSLINKNNDDDVEEISRWTNERFTPSTDGGQLRSFTEMRIYQNSVAR